MWRHLVAKFATNARGAMLLLNLIQVTESISGSVVPLAMFYLLLLGFVFEQMKHIKTKISTYGRKFATKS